MKKINVGADGGTTAIMRWIKENNCPVLDSCAVYSQSGIPTMFVSTDNDESVAERMKDAIKDGLCHEYDGMYRLRVGISAFLIKVNDVIYYASRY